MDSASNILYQTLRSRFSPARLAPYEAAAGDDTNLALELYEWNMRVGGAFFEDLGALEVLLRNALDLQLRRTYQATDATPWYRQVALQQRGRERVDIAINLATRRGKDPEQQDKVIAELSFGFWRYLLGAHYQSTLWPAMRQAFAHPPPGQLPGRRDIEARVDSLHFLRNRVAHHEPILSRDLERDHRHLVAIAGLICPRTQAWIVGRSRVREVLAQKPPVESTRVVYEG